DNDKKMMDSLIAAANNGVSPTQTPIDKVVAEAQDLANAKDFEGAAKKLDEAEGLAENKAAIWYMQSVNALQMNKKDVALERINKALEKDPTNVTFLAVKASIENEDPVDRLLQTSKGLGLSDEDLAVRRVLDLSMLKQQLEAVVEAQSANPNMKENLAKSTAYLDHAKKELDAQLELALKLKPDSPQLYEFRFNRAILQKDWNTAETLLSKIKDLNIDSANGLLFQGRLERAEGKPAQSIRTLEKAVDQVGFMSAAWRELGQSFQAVGNFGQALNAYKQAYERNPNDLPVVKEYLGLLIGQGQPTDALTLLASAQRLAPGDKGLREQALQLEYQYRDKGLAIRKRREIWKNSPDDVQNATQLAYVLASTEPTRELLTDDQGNAKFDSDRWERMTIEDRTKILQTARDDWNKEADGIITKLATGKINPRDLMLVQSRLKLLRGDERGGEKVIQDFIAGQDPVTPEMWITLGKYQQEVHMLASAEASFKKAEKLQEKDDRDGQRALAALYFTSGHFSDAEPVIREILEVDNSASVQHQLIECLMREEKFEDARAQLNSLHASGQASMVSTLLESGIAGGLARKAHDAGHDEVAQQEFAKQDDALSRAAQLDPTSPIPHLYRAQALIAQYEQSKDPTKLSDAMQSLDKADQIRAGMPDVTYTRVRVLRLRDDMSGALSELQRLVAARPDDGTARNQLISMLMEMNRVDAAIQVVNDASNKYPSSPMWPEVLGDIYKLRKNDQAQAAMAYQRANNLVPSATLVTKMTESLLSTPAPDFQKLQDLIEQHPEFMEGVPYLHVLYVRVLAGAKENDEALKQLRLAYKQYQDFIKDGKLQPGDIDRFGEGLAACFGSENPNEIEKFMNDVSGGDMGPYEMRLIAVLWFATGGEGMSKAVDMEKRAIAKFPATDVQGRTTMQLETAKYLLILQRFDQSAAMYEEALKSDTRQPDALNNLAYILAENLNRASDAVPYADRALALRPDDPDFLDTAGWVYYKAGKLDQGREYLEQSLGKRDSVPTAINLVHVLTDMGKYDDAMDAASRAERILNSKAGTKPDPNVVQQIQALKDEIRKKQAGG
ncbi:MAG TPA: tetratricopeptide repeat protein, partial [Phycisphaerales bacterium]|nr:tetratricopeptide repeat protein [Phycisphaerales bacterium]